jgi:hypothetical protein
LTGSATDDVLGCYSNDTQARIEMGALLQSMHLLIFGDWWCCTLWPSRAGR